MIDDIGGQMVSGLQNLWTGYWDWEIRGIETGRVMTDAEETALTDINYDAKKQSTLFKLMELRKTKTQKI